MSESLALESVKVDQETIETSRHPSATVVINHLKMLVKDDEPLFETTGKAIKIGQSMQLAGTGKAKTILLQRRSDRKNTYIGLEITHGTNDEIENMFPSTSLLEEETWALLVVPVMLIVVLFVGLVVVFRKAYLGEPIQFTKNGLINFSLFFVAFSSIMITVMIYVMKSTVRYGVASQIESSYTASFTFFYNGEQYSMTVEVYPVRPWHRHMPDTQLFGYDRLAIEDGIGELRGVYKKLTGKRQAFEKKRQALQRRLLDSRNRLKQLGDTDEILKPVYIAEEHELSAEYDQFMGEYEAKIDIIETEINKCVKLFTSERDDIFEKVSLEKLREARESLEVDHEVERAQLLQEKNSLITDQIASEKIIDGQRKELVAQAEHQNDIIAERVAYHSGGIFSPSNSFGVIPQDQKRVSSKDMMDFSLQFTLIIGAVIILAFLISAISNTIERISEVTTLNLFLMFMIIAIAMIFVFGFAWFMNKSRSRKPEQPQYPQGAKA